MTQQPPPRTTVVLAMSADGKIADVNRSPARFGSIADKAHLEKQIARSDAVLFGADTLRAYGTTLTVSHPDLLQHRLVNGKPSQPIHIVISNSGKFNPDLRFFKQPVERWLISTATGAMFWQARAEFKRILVFETPTGEVDIYAALQQLTILGIAQLGVLGGSKLVANLLELNLINEIWLTVCPLILGGFNAPTPVGGCGFLAKAAPRLELMEVRTENQEVFLHYCLQQFPD
ncbi:pyrimidine reductase, riboflavin biosynthesis [Rivularia sp. PCC 7116]|uniref:RibD family protein n=1 Tax=Rivularia sp. PCC 7116 TaxID=373994 RepID=UPI00029EE1D8|nr:RibD family protein [Rivularia sp. PCC 7116]AFY55592.1 pyrimidine reductase, riboflavin biosynthesis [Rivularia sp. PCC 7116]